MTFPCPKCGRVLEQSGEMLVGDVDDPKNCMTVATFQCDECIVERDFAGEMIETALTFALDEEGHPFDPADPEGRLDF